MTTVSAAYLDVYVGEQKFFDSDSLSYEATRSLLAKNSKTYCLPAAPELLTADQQQILQDLHATSHSRLYGKCPHCPQKNPEIPLLFTPPIPLLAGRIIFDLDPSPGLVKTRTNFITLCTGEKKSKNAPTKQLHYAQSPMHRVIKGFVAQGGDVTRGDGSGGESIFGPKFPCEKAGLQNTPVRGSIAMANSGGKSPTSSSQFFIVLSEDERVAKLKGKYVIFGRTREGDLEAEKVLQRLDQVGSITSDERPTQPVWIGDCGLC
ncbi:cyclophilin-like domain-containing protein [Mycena floridula]|nr:cyclophilin-like domain-containing protein [Mycena floridula]